MQSFTDLSNLGNIDLPQGPKDILGFSDDLNHLQAWTDKIFTYWKGQTNKYQPLGKVGISIINDLFCRDIYVKPLIKFELEEEEKVRIKLTGQQARILTMLGTGKSCYMRRCWHWKNSLSSSARKRIGKIWQKNLNSLLQRFVR